MFSSTAAALSILLLSSNILVKAFPTSYSLPNSTSNHSTSAASSYWLANIQRQGIAPFSSNATWNGYNASYQIFRNVKDFGAVGDGVTDDTAAINKAASTGGRCGLGCDSSTLTPALVYFPPGTYRVSAPIIQYYYTQFVGDAISLPTLKATANFTGIAVIDSNPFDDSGNNWYLNTNNFYRQVRNFVIDITAMNASFSGPYGMVGTCIHWEVGQATSLQNIRFEMVQGGAGNLQQGLFMDSGSGGFISDLTFNGGHYGAFFAAQQFTTRNMTFNNCQTAVYMDFDWVFTFKSLSIDNCGVGLNMSNGGFNQSVGSVLVQDSKFSGTPKGIITSYGNGSIPATGGTLVLDNVDFTGCQSAVYNLLTNKTILAGGNIVDSWAQGSAYNSGSGATTTPGYTSPPPYGNATLVTYKSTGTAPSMSTSTSSASGTNSTNLRPQLKIQGSITAPQKPAALLNAQGAFFERSKPQYENYPVSSFISVKSAGAKGDGNTDDTAAIQAALNKAGPNDIVYFDHGAYLITYTVTVPPNVKITGELWPVIMATGSAFQDQSNPQPVFQVGKQGDSGAVEMSDLIFSTSGSVPGAILVQWNVAESSQGASGMWDVHFRIGGAAGTALQYLNCPLNPNVTVTPDPKCEGTFLLLHVTGDGGVYLENNWFWVADHDLDASNALQDGPTHGRINVYNGRGVLLNTKGPVWMYGSSSEHSQLYQYQVINSENVYMAIIQTETPYYQPNPTAVLPFTPNNAYNDPNFNGCTTDSCRKSWGLRVTGSSDIFLYGAGLYSFFDNYEQTCVATNSCQENMVDLESNEGAIYLYGLSTKASTYMVSSLGQGLVAGADNMDTFCQTVAVFEDA